MSTQIDINTIGDLVALYGTEGDRRAWLRVRAEIDRARAELAAVRAGRAILRRECDERQERTDEMTAQVDHLVNRLAAIEQDTRAAAREATRPAAIDRERLGRVLAEAWHDRLCYPGGRFNWATMHPDSRETYRALAEAVARADRDDRPAPEACRLSCARAVEGGG